MTAPQRIVPPLSDQPVVDPTGRPSFSMTQWMARLSAFVGPVSTTTTTSLSEQVVTLVSTTTQAQTDALAQIANLQTAIDALNALMDTQTGTAQPAPTFTPVMPPAQMVPTLLPPPPPPQPLPVFIPQIVPTTPIPPMLPQNGIVYLANGARIIDGYGAPTGVVIGSIGDIYLQRDGAAGGIFYVKTSGLLTDSGWTGVA